MKILELCLSTANLPAAKAFYSDLLGLPTVFYTPEQIGFQLGQSLLVFRQSIGFTGRYHLAFDVPNNQLDQAQAWLEARAPLLPDQEGAVCAHIESWNADQVYFLDPAGNVLELIARHTANTASNNPLFSGQSLLSISEIGLATPDVPTTVAWLRDQFDLPIYRNSSDAFTAVGNENGLFIVVKDGREWFPSTGVMAVPLAVEVVLEGTLAKIVQMPELPYVLRVVEGKTSIESKKSALI
jgi:catechol 2,3-dioxygenase-like lactoylglutathione lyase family enzyme